MRELSGIKCERCKDKKRGGEEERRARRGDCQGDLFGPSGQQRRIIIFVGECCWQGKSEERPRPRLELYHVTNAKSPDLDETRSGLPTIDNHRFHSDHDIHAIHI